MPLVQPQAWDKAYNPWIPRVAEDFWNKLPAHIRSDLRSNYQTISDAPNPGLPIGAADDLLMGGAKSAVAIPAMLANPKTRTFLKKVMGGLDLGEAVPAVRNQQENFPFPFTQWIKDRIPRGSLFFSPGGHKFEYGEMGMGAQEGGPYKVEWLQKLKNPLVIKRDETGFLAEHVLRTLLGSESVKQGNKYVSVPNEEGRRLLKSISHVANNVLNSSKLYRKGYGPSRQEAIDNILKYIEPKQLESSLAARDAKTSLGEAIASELARGAGYDSIISTRPKLVVPASQKMANEATVKRLREYQKIRSKSGSSEFMYPSGTSKEDLKKLIDPWVSTPAKDRLFRKLGITKEQFSGKIARDIYKRIENYPTTRPELAKVSDFADTLIKKVAKRGAKTELMPTQAMLIDKQILKEMRQKGKDYLNPPRTTLGSFGQSIVNFFKSGQMQSDALPDVLKFNLEQGTIAPEEIQLIQQAINQ